MYFTLVGEEVFCINFCDGKGGWDSGTNLHAVFPNQNI